MMNLRKHFHKNSASLPGKIRAEISDFFTPLQSDRRPLASEKDARNAKIIVSCYDNFSDVRHAGWGNLVDAARRCTPGGSCVWDGVAFVRGENLKPDWHLIFNSIDWHRHSVTFRGSPERVIFAVCEPPTKIHRPWHEAQGTDTIVLTCDQGLAKKGVRPRRYLTEASLTPSWTVGKTYDELQTESIDKKSKILSWVCSNESSMHGHKYRLAFLERLKAELEFDHFGRGFRPINDKWDALAPYRYSVAFENFRADYYFTEKLTDCFVAETMPIYFGSDIISEFFPPESMVIIDPEDPDVLKIIRDVIRSDRWFNNRDAILESKRLVLEEYNLFARLARFIKLSNEGGKGNRKKLKVRQIHLDYSQDA